MCRPSPQKKEVIFLSFTQMGIFDGVIWLCLFTGTWRNILAEWLWQVIYKNIFQMTLGPCKQCLKIFSEDLKVSSRSDIQTTWGMARASLSSSELGANLSAWLAKITAQLIGLTAPSQAVCITTPIWSFWWVMYNFLTYSSAWTSYFTGCYHFNLKKFTFLERSWWQTH